MTLDDLINTEKGSLKAAQDAVSKGDANRSGVLRLSALVADLTAVLGTAQAAKDAAGAALDGLAPPDSAPLEKSVEAALAKLDIDLQAAVSAPPDPKYADKLAAAQKAATDFQAATVTAAEAWADVESSRRKIRAHVAALNAYVASLTAASVQARSLAGMTLDGSPANLAQAWWQLQKSGALSKLVQDKALAVSLKDDVDAACDAFAKAEQAALDADAAAATALDTKAKADTDLGDADAQVLAALVAAVKAAPAAKIAPAKAPAGKAPAVKPTAEKAAPPQAQK